MRLRDYFGGLPLRVATRLPPEEVERRINAAAPSPLGPFATGVLGQARSGWVQLRYRPGLFSYKGMPMLTGPIEAAGSGSVLSLVYRGRLATRLAFLLGYSAIGIMVLVFIAFGGWAPGIEPREKALAIAMLGIVALLPLGVHMIGIRGGEAHLEALANFLRTTLDASDGGAVASPRP